MLADNDQLNNEDQLDEPFNLAFETPTMETPNHPSQGDALKAALQSLLFDEANNFESQQVKNRPIARLKKQYHDVREKDILPRMTTREQISWKGSPDVVESRDETVSWTLDQFYLDLLICRGRDMGLSTLLPKRTVDHSIEFVLEFKWSPRTFSPKFANLQFDPIGAMHFIGRTFRNEDAWIGWIPSEATGESLDDQDHIAPGTCSGSTQMSTHHWRGAFMFFAAQLCDIGYRDVYVEDRYPDLDDAYAIENATNLGSRVVRLTLESMRSFDIAVRDSYDGWIRDAPASYKADGFFSARRPVAITSRYGQNQRLGGDVAHSVEEDTNWDRDRLWEDISHVSVALATHIRAKTVRSWRNRTDFDAMFPNPDDDALLYDSPDPHRRDSISREELPRFPMFLDTGEIIRIFDEEGFEVSRRNPRFVQNSDSLGALLNFERIGEMFEPPADLDDEDENGTTKYQVYPQAGLLSCGHVVAQGLMWPYGNIIRDINSSLRHGVQDDGDVLPDESPAVIGVGSQFYNALMHSTRGNSTQQHGVVVGDVTAALAGFWAQGTSLAFKAESKSRTCDLRLPHEAYLCKIRDRPISRDLRVENVFGITMSKVHPSKHSGKVILNEILLPIANQLRHPSILDELKQHIVLFKPDVYPMIYAWSTNPITQLITKIYKHERDNMRNGKPVNPLNVELCAVLERALNFMHSGNAKVIASSVMDALWIGRSVILDGLPCLNPGIVRFFGESSWQVVAEHMPYGCSGIPFSAARRVIQYNYNDLIFNRYSANLAMTVAQARPKLSITKSLNDVDSASKSIIYHALTILVQDIQDLVTKHVESAIKYLLCDPDASVSRHARKRRDALKAWRKVANPLAWDLPGNQSGNYALLSLLLCEDANTVNPVLQLSRTPITYQGLLDHLSGFFKMTNTKRVAPLTRTGGFQFVLPLAYRMVSKQIPQDNDKSQYWSHHACEMMRSMRIHLLPWQKDSKNAYATDLAYWMPLSQRPSQHRQVTLTIENRIEQAAEREVLNNPHAPWSVPERLVDMKGLWSKQILPTCWKLESASLGSMKEEGRYVTDTYQFVADNYDGANWIHHFSLIIAILFSRVTPRICIDNNDQILGNTPEAATIEIRAFRWIVAQSAYHKGTIAPLPFIVMMSTTLIGFLDARSPFRQYLLSSGGTLGKPWSDKHGPKQIHALNFIRMGLAIAKSKGVRKNSKLYSNWEFKSDEELKAIYTKLLTWLKEHRFGEYLSIRFIFGEEIAQQLTQNHQFKAPG